MVEVHRPEEDRTTSLPKKNRNVVPQLRKSTRRTDFSGPQKKKRNKKEKKNPPKRKSLLKRLEARNGLGTKLYPEPKNHKKKNPPKHKTTQHYLSQGKGIGFG